MIIVETCPECGHDLRDEVICTYPPIPRKVCYNCGWSWEGKQEEVIRVPFSSFGGRDYTADDLAKLKKQADELEKYTSLNLTNYALLNSDVITNGTIHIPDFGSNIVKL